MKNPGRKPSKALTVAPKPLTRKQATRAFARSLKRLGVDPLEQLLTRDMPLLEPEERAKIWLALLPYVYTRLNAINVLSEDSNKSQTNLVLAKSLELPSGTQGPSLNDLLRIASQPEPVLEENHEDDDEIL